MKVKQKVLVITIIAVMALAIIGLTIGLVLVAQQATLNNSMTVSYTANNVDATITATGVNYSTATATTGTTIELSDGTTDNLTTKTFTFVATQSEATGGVEFEKAELTATGRAVYTFVIKNTANASNTKVLKALVTANNLTSSDNVVVSIGATEATATEVTTSSNRYYAEIGGGQVTGNIVVVIKVDDSTIDVTNFTLGLDMELGYNVEDPNAFDWSSATTTDNLDIIWGIRNRSDADFTLLAPIYGTLVANNSDYIVTHSVDIADSSTTIELGIKTTNTTDKFLFTITYLTLDDNTIFTDSCVFDAGLNTTGEFLTGVDGTPYCSILKDNIMWGTSANALAYNGGWYDTDIKILVEITPNS